MSAGENDEVDQDFLDGFEHKYDESTTTPVRADDADDATAKEEPQAQVTETSASDDAAAKKPEFRITKADYDALIAKAATIDEMRAEQKQIKDTAFVRIGGLQQIINELQSSTKRGQTPKVTPQHFQELIDDGYEDLAKMTANGFNRILSELDVVGTSGAAPISREEISKAFEQQFTPARESMKAELRAEMAAETLNDLHEDWQSLVRTNDFQKWMSENKVTDLKDRYGVPFAESIDARFVAKHISAFKESAKKLEAAKQKQAARQTRIEAAVQPQGTGGHAQSQTEEDDFYSGFKGANQY